MSDFLRKLRAAREDAVEQQKQKQQEQRDERQRELDRNRLVDEVADQVELHTETCLKDFCEEFVEFRMEAYTENGRNFRVFWNEPGRGSEKFFHQLGFRVRRYHEYADVEVEAKLIVRNSERRRHAREEDVFDGDPNQLLRFVEQQICTYARLYTEGRGW